MCCEQTLLATYVLLGCDRLGDTFASVSVFASHMHSHTKQDHSLFGQVVQQNLEQANSAGD